MKITDLVCFKSILVLRGKRVKGENEFVMLPLFFNFRGYSALLSRQLFSFSIFKKSREVSPLIGGNGGSFQILAKDGTITTGIRHLKEFCFYFSGAQL